MNPKLLLCLALVLSGGLFGCSTARPTFVTGDTDSKPIRLPIKFAGYREFYTFVAQHTSGGVPTNADTLFNLAADSTTKIITLGMGDSRNEKMPYVYLVTPHYYNGGVFDQIRGAQGNGEYYILRPLSKYTALDTDKGFELVGILEGNAYTVQDINVNETPRFVSYWHLSAGEHPESIYEWNGKFFAQIK
jgi:hypothetical protein